MERPTYTNLNRLIAQILSSITASLRFDGALNCDLTEFQTNLVPYPRIHYPLATYGPLVTPNKAYHEKMEVEEITAACFQPSNQMVKCNPKDGERQSHKIIPSSPYPNIREVHGCLPVVPRGRGPEGRECCHHVREEVSEPAVRGLVPDRVQGRDQLPAPTAVPGGDCGLVRRAVCCISNSTAIQQAWRRLDYRVYHNSMSHYSGLDLDDD